MATIIQKNTRKLVEKKLDALFAKQQQLNGNKGGEPTMQEGGYTYGKSWQNPNTFFKDQYKVDFGLPQMNTGPANWYGPMAKVNFTSSPNLNLPSVDSSLAYTAPSGGDLNLPYNAGSLNEPKQSNINFSNPKDNPNIPGFKPQPAGKNKTDWGKVGSFAAQMSPMLYNMAKGLQRPDKVKPNYNPYENNIRSLMANRRFNVEPLLNANLIAQAVSNRNIRNTANSRGEMMSNLGASQNYRMAGDAAAWTQKNNMDNQYLSEQAQMDANLGANRSQMDWMTQMGNAQNKSATNQFLGQGFNDLGQFAQIQQQMSNQKMRDAQLASLYPDMYSQIYQFQPAMQAIIKAAGK